MSKSQLTKPSGHKTLQYAYGNAGLCDVLVAQSEGGICSVVLGQDETAILEALKQEFPTSELVSDQTVVNTALNQVITLIQQPTSSFQLPIILKGTPFQQIVWQAIRSIPAGQTISYQQLAECIGNPKAVRAVARACAMNKLAVIVPCHRVIASSGNLAGYRWGLEIKRLLLDYEARIFITS